jgi:hypothetical protein
MSKLTIFDLDFGMIARARIAYIVGEIQMGRILDLNNFDLANISNQAVVSISIL